MIRLREAWRALRQQDTVDAQRQLILDLREHLGDLALLKFKAECNAAAYEAKLHQALAKLRKAYGVAR